MTKYDDTHDSKKATKKPNELANAFAFDNGLYYFL